MKKLILFTSFCFLFLGINAQKKQKTITTQDYLRNCVTEEQNKGASTVIVIGNLCSACLGDYITEGFVFTKDSSENYMVRYIKYADDSYNNIEIIKDIIFKDDFTSFIFKIVEQYHDTLFYELSNMEQLLIDTFRRNGELLYRENSSSHGKYRFLGLYHNGKKIYSVEQIIILNKIFDRAYYYWLLYSTINNYNADFLDQRLKVKER